MLGDKTNPGYIQPGEVRSPGGRPKGSTGRKYNIKERLLGKYKTHPVDRLVVLANALEARGQFEEAAKVWENLLKYFEPTKKPVESAPEKATPEGSVEAAEETFRLLQEMEQDGLKPTESSKGNGLEIGPTNVSPEASPETDLPGHKEQ